MTGTASQYAKSTMPLGWVDCRPTTGRDRYLHAAADHRNRASSVSLGGDAGCSCQPVLLSLDRHPTSALGAGKLYQPVAANLRGRPPFWPFSHEA